MQSIAHLLRLKLIISKDQFIFSAKLKYYSANYTVSYVQLHVDSLRFDHNDTDMANGSTKR